MAKTLQAARGEDGEPPFRRYDHAEGLVTALAVDYPPGHVTPAHRHPHAQLLHAVHGVMVVSTQQGQWVVPPTRGMWVPAETEHSTRMVGVVHMRTAFIRPEAAPDLPDACAVLGISPLLRELIIAALDIAQPYAADSRAGRLMGLLLDELRTLPTLPLHLPQPSDPRLRRICEQLLRAPDDNSTATQWAERLHVDAKTIQRLFARETGMSFGRWRQQARLLAALERLARGERVLDTALALGYASPAAFATMFKRQFGVVPSTYFQ